MGSGWRCKLCVDGRTYRRPPKNICKKCDPNNRIGRHHQKVLSRRLRQKTTAKPSLFQFGWQATSGSRTASVDNLLQALEGEMDDLKIAAAFKMSHVHSVLGVAYAWLERVRDCKVTIPASCKVHGLLTFAMAAGPLSDPDELRAGYMKRKNFGVKSFRHSECVWANVIGNFEEGCGTGQMQF